MYRDHLFISSESFAKKHKLSLSPHGHSVTWHHEYYQVFMFAEQQHAELFGKEFGGEPMHPSERGRGKKWAQWKKGSYKQKPKSPHDCSED
jgi:hypothetical protein